MPTMPKASKVVKWIAPRQAHARRAAPTDPKRYNNRLWRSVSANHRRSFPLCAVCESLGRTREALVTDHVIPVSMGGAMFDTRNHLSLCDYMPGACHSTKSGMEAAGRPICPFVFNEAGDKIPADVGDAIEVLARRVGR